MQHFFLQHLPSIPHLRSLYIPFLADHVHGTNADPRELALQIVDIVALRPEVELCYMGIANKCFEILESKRDHHDLDARNESHLGLPASDPDEEDEEEVVDMGEEDDDDDDDDSEVTESDVSSSGYQTDSNSDDEASAGKNGTARLRLREILFYDDKVAVFKARHGRL